MELYKTIISFRGKCYKNTLYNRVVASFLTFSYRLKILLTSLFVFATIFGTTSCNSQSANIESYFDCDSVFVDSFGVSGHSYIRFIPVIAHSRAYRFAEVIHNPDCYCRYHRTFVVIKKNK